MELLVVIAIIAVLASLAVPAVSSALEKGKLAQKISNLRNIWALHGLYMADNSGRILPVNEEIQGADTNWRERLYQYMAAAGTSGKALSAAQKQKVFIDPFFTGHDPNLQSGSRTGYAMNTRPALPADNKQNVQWNATPANQEKQFRLFQITEASKRILISDSDNEWYYNIPSKPAKSSLTMTRHAGGTKGMALMYDGSTQLLTIEQAVIATEDPSKLDLSKGD